MQSKLKDLFFYVPMDMSFFSLVGRLIILAVLLIWGWKLIFATIASNAAGESFLHLVNTPFHEAGHIFFRPLGRFLTSLGGTLGQLLMPLICMTVFLLQTRDTFAAAVGLWWFGENFLDIAPYIGDARAGVLPLLGGNRGHSSPYGFHDWEFLLTETGLLRYDQTLARLSHSFGSMLMILALAWGGYILWKAYNEAV
ncbi:MAG: zinc ribbon domain-containing protein [Candidatus Electrothrix sp. MAN1_4]|nr:zinc ribbon domain-containing protein [Candidatus Electrothrix sp. MAN1_4]